uniref:acid phosphatase n=1 Tax=Comana monomorpha TaxID=1555636 RepID=A0AAU6PBL3_9NEOP
MLRLVLMLAAAAQFGLIQSLTTDRSDQELLLAYVVNRHGERTPDVDELSLSNEKERLQEFIDLHGFEGLTNIGKARVYKLGQFLRDRYGPDGYGLLSKVYYHDDIYLRSTDKERTKMTAQIVMSAVYPPPKEQQWNDDLGKLWQPVPYTAVPLSEDYLRYYSNCRRFKTLMQRAKEASVQEELAPFLDLEDLLMEKTNRNFTEDPTMYQTLYDLFRSQDALGLEIPAWANTIMPRLAEAARLAYRLYFRNEEMKKIGGGVILNDFVQDAVNIISGKTVKQRFHMYSSHDFNLGSLLEVSNVEGKEWIVPHYASLFGLELYRSKSTGKFTVQPLYLPQAGDAEPEALRFEGCHDSTYCDFSIFQSNTAKYLLPEREFYEICNIRTELGH